MHPKISVFLREAENLWESLNPIERPIAEIFLAEQLCTFISNVMDDDPELEKEFDKFIDIMRLI